MYLGTSPRDSPVDLVFCLLVPLHIQIVLGVFWMWALGNEQFILDNALRPSGSGGYKEAFRSALCVYPEQFSLQITVIWENIKRECFTEIIPCFWTSQIACTCGSLFRWHVKTPPQYPDLSKLVVLALLGRFRIMLRSVLHFPFCACNSCDSCSVHFNFPVICFQAMECNASKC